MVICKGCGKKGMFLNLNSRGLCSECVELMKMDKSSGTIIIGLNGVNTGEVNKVVGHSDEEVACNYLINELVKAGFNRTKFNIEHRSQDYTSLFYALVDIARIKITDNVKWITIPLCTEDRKKTEVASLFEDKTMCLRHCKSYFHSINELSRYVKYISVLTPIEHYGSSRKLTDNEKEVIDYTYNYMVSIGADKDCFYLYPLTQEVELIYKSWHCAVRYKLYKKGGGKITYRTITNSRNSDTFVELSDIRKYEKDLKKTIQYANSDKYSYDDMLNYIKYIYPLKKVDNSDEID